MIPQSLQEEILWETWAVNQVYFESSGLKHDLQYGAHVLQQVCKMPTRQNFQANRLRLCHQTTVSPAELQQNLNTFQLNTFPASLNQPEFSASLQMLTIHKTVQPNISTLEVVYIKHLAALKVPFSVVPGRQRLQLGGI